MVKKKEETTETEIVAEATPEVAVKEVKAVKKLKKNAKKKVEKVKLTEAEYEKKVLGLSAKGLTSEKIGEALKKEGIHSKEYAKKISQILGKDYVSPDLTNVTNKLENLKVHVKANKQDKRAMRDKDRIFSQLRKIKKYLGLI